MQNFSYENEFHLHENELVGETHFHKNSFALRLVLTQRQTRTRKWAIQAKDRNLGRTRGKLLNNQVKILVLVRAVIRMWDKGTRTRILKSECVATFKGNIKKFASNFLFCPVLFFQCPPTSKRSETPMRKWYEFIKPVTKLKMAQNNF